MPQGAESAALAGRSRNHRRRLLLLPVAGQSLYVWCNKNAGSRQQRSRSGMPMPMCTLRSWRHPGQEAGYGSKVQSTTIVTLHRRSTVRLLPMVNRRPGNLDACQVVSLQESRKAIVSLPTSCRSSKCIARKPVSSVGAF